MAALLKVGSPNSAVRIASALKNLAVSAESKPRRILSGPFKGISMRLSLRSQSQIWLGTFEKETHPWLKRLARDIATAIDIGVAQGEHTIYFLAKTNASKVLAFEPDPVCLPRLRENLALNGLSHTHRLEISDKYVGDGEVDDQTTLDSLAAVVGTPCIVKMDVDGAEEAILRGAGVFNCLPDLRWLIETHSRELELACIAILSSGGFKTQIVPNGWWRTFLPERRPIPHNRWLVAWKNSARIPSPSL